MFVPFFSLFRCQMAIHHISFSGPPSSGLVFLVVFCADPPPILLSQKKKKRLQTGVPNGEGLGLGDQAAAR